MPPISRKSLWCEWPWNTARTDPDRSRIARTSGELLMAYRFSRSIRWWAKTIAGSVARLHDEFDPGPVELIDALAQLRSRFAVEPVVRGLLPSVMKIGDRPHAQDGFRRTLRAPGAGRCKCARREPERSGSQKSPAAQCFTNSLPGSPDDWRLRMRPQTVRTAWAETGWCRSSIRAARTGKFTAIWRRTRRSDRHRGADARDGSVGRGLRTLQCRRASTRRRRAAMRGPRDSRPEGSQAAAPA